MKARIKSTDEIVTVFYTPIVCTEVGFKRRWPTRELDFTVPQEEPLISQALSDQDLIEELKRRTGLEFDIDAIRKYQKMVKMCAEVDSRPLNLITHICSVTPDECPYGAGEFCIGIKCRYMIEANFI